MAAGDPLLASTLTVLQKNMKIRNCYIGDERRAGLLYAQDTPAMLNVYFVQPQHAFTNGSLDYDRHLLDKI